MHSMIVSLQYNGVTLILRAGSIAQSQGSVAMKIAFTFIFLWQICQSLDILLFDWYVRNESWNVCFNEWQNGCVLFEKLFEYFWQHHPWNFFMIFDWHFSTQFRLLFLRLFILPFHYWLVIIDWPSRYWYLRVYPCIWVYMTRQCTRVRRRRLHLRSPTKKKRMWPAWGSGGWCPCVRILYSRWCLAVFLIPCTTTNSANMLSIFVLPDARFYPMWIFSSS